MGAIITTLRTELSSFKYELFLLNPFDRTPRTTRETEKMPSQRMKPMVFVNRRIANVILITRKICPATLPFINFPFLVI